MIITLMGFMGSGKTSIGRRLEDILGLECIDLDEYIVHNENRDINQIFQSEGEQHFRLLETKYLKELITSGKDIIIPLGGGAPCHSDSWPYINKSTSIYLKRSEDYLFENLKSKKKKRPLIKKLSDKDLRKLIKFKLEERTPYYQMADIIIEANGTKKEIAYQIVRQYIKGLV